MPKLVTLGFTALLFVASVQLSVVSANQCVSLPDGAVPDELSQGWAERGFSWVDLVIDVETKSGERVIIGDKKYYIHDNGMKLGVYSYFDKVVFRAWSCDKNRDPVTGDTRDHMIAVPQSDGSWLIRHAQSPDVVDVIFDDDGNPNGVRITLHGIETLFNK